MLIYVIENLYRQHKLEFDNITNQMKQEMKYDSIDSYFENLQKIEQKYTPIYNKLLKTIYTQSKDKLEKDLANISLHCEDLKYLNDFLTKKHTTEGHLYALYHIITNHHSFNNCEEYISKFNNLYKSWEAINLGELSERIHIAKIMMDGNYVCQNIFRYEDAISLLLNNKANINKHINTTYLNDVLNQHILQFLDIFFRKRKYSYSLEKVLRIERDFDSKMQSELYFPNYEYSPFYADIKLSFKRVEEKNNYNDNTWTIQKYIDLCENNPHNTIKILTQHNYINQDFYFFLREIAKGTKNDQ